MERVVEGVALRAPEEAVAPEDQYG